PVELGDDGVAEREAAAFALGATAADPPGIVACLRHLAPEVERQSFAGDVDQRGERRRILPGGGSKGRLQFDHPRHSGRPACLVPLRPGGAAWRNSRASQRGGRAAERRPKQPMPGTLLSWPESREPAAADRAFSPRGARTFARAPRSDVTATRSARARAPSLTYRAESLHAAQRMVQRNETTVSSSFPDKGAT